MTEFTNLGIVSKVFGFKGEIIIKLNNLDASIFYKLNSLFIKIDENYIPFILESRFAKNNNFIRIKLKGIDNEQLASKYVDKKIYVEKSLIPEEKIISYSDFDELIEYEIYDQNNLLISTVDHILDYQHNNIIVCFIDNKEILLPTNIIVQIIEEQKRIIMNIPDGLIEFYQK